MAKNEVLIDSLKSTEHPYALLITGDLAAARGSDLANPAGMGKVDETVIADDGWRAGLTPIEQANPVNQAKYETANSIPE